jgi:hypothetical protein
VSRASIFAVLLLTLSPQAWPAGASGQEQGGEPKRATAQTLRAGAGAIDIGPVSFPVLVNGGFLQNRATRINDPVRAKCLVLDDGSTRLAIVVVDTCMMPRELIDRAKVLAREKTGIRTDRMLISATHTHSAPAAMGTLGCPADENYVALLPGKIAESIARAARNLEPARIGYGVIDDNQHTFCRRWIRRPDKLIEDPFGQHTARANMHPGYQNPDVIGPAGPVDPGLTVLSVQSRAGRPIAVLANYSMHYYGAEPVSADYFGRFAAALARLIGADAVNPPFVGIMSQGTSGDQMWMDYGGPKKDPGLEAYASAVVRVAHQAYRRIAYEDDVSLAMVETTLELARRVPDRARLAWARGVVARMRAADGDQNKEPARVPRTLPEVYADEALFLHEEPRRTLKLQAVRIGKLAITAIPNEVFAITGLKFKAQSPFDTTMNIELANGSEGYIPPPEQHKLGGYTTWPARTAGLEVQAEPRIVATVLGLLEQIAAGGPRRELRAARGPYVDAILAARPLAYWRLDEIQGNTAVDCTGHSRHATYEGGVALYLPGANLSGVSGAKATNRAVHLAGGLLKAQHGLTSAAYSVELWFWQGLPADLRPITGYVLSSSAGHAALAPGDQVGIGGTQGARRRLFFAGSDPSAGILTGKTEISPKVWHHLVFVREREHVTIYLDGNAAPEIAGAAGALGADRPALLLVGGRSDGLAGFEGKIDEVALYDRALAADEVAGHVRAATAP